jgi:thymidylate synthase
MHHYREETLDDLIRVVLEDLLADGAPVLPAPTQRGCVEFIGVAIELTNPRARVSRSATRGRLLSALAELTWYLARSNKTEHIAHYIRSYRQYDQDGSIWGAYGPRLFNWDGVNQVHNITEALRLNPSTRRAVIQLFDRNDVATRRMEAPCTTTLQYLLRGNRLHAVTHMRSNDAFLGLPHDIFCFTMLQELIARTIGAELGSYHHLVGSLHLYDRHRDEAQDFLDEGWHTRKLTMPQMPEGDPWASVERLVRAEVALRAGHEIADSDVDPEPYWADLARLFAAYEARKGSPHYLSELHEALEFDFYRVFVKELIERNRKG